MQEYTREWQGRGRSISAGWKNRGLESIQKTRAGTGDPTSRLYGVDQYHLLGVCLGKKTGDWTEWHLNFRNLLRGQSFVFMTWSLQQGL